ncbi:MAG: DUF115 domain-containing protein [Parachlamydiaceae bacterium]|nr:DUF115 domain-containing protein [Parachlamydiaceae bacterium]
MQSENQFHRHLELWARSHPKEALLMPYIDTEGLAFCETVAGEHNLCREIDGTTATFYEQSGALDEAKKWFSTIDSTHVGALYVYGLGLGYYYKSAAEWLHADKERTLIFLEDDLVVLHRFFELDQAAELLNDPQVYIAYLRDPSITSEVLDEVYWHVALDTAQVSALNYYKKTKKATYEKLCFEVAYGSELKKALIEEYLEFGAPFFANCYQNLLDLPRAYRGNSIYGKFQKIPAIICGAGPSLEKNMELLKQLHGRALIFAGGSAINILNTASIQPHLCGAIDPNEAQNVRLSNTQAYEVPFFYRNRLNPHALKTIHGPHLYLTGSGGYDVAQFFESKFGLEGDDIDEGHNVVTFCLEIAQRMGCDPIIFLGMDLAFTDRKTYSSGVVFDPAVEQKTLDEYANFETTGLMHKDIYGKPIYTLWKWISESEWIGEWAKNHPEIKLVNCTEGGIGFPSIIKKPFKEAAEELLVKQYDLEGLVHSEIQLSGMTGVTESEVIATMTELQASLSRCLENLEALITDVEATKEKLLNVSVTEPIQQSGLAALAEIELADEVGYTAILAIFNQVYARLLNSELQQIQHNIEYSSDQERQLKRSDLNSKRLKFLYTVAGVNRQIIDYAIEQHGKKQDVVGEKPREEVISPFRQDPKVSRLKWKQEFTEMDVKNVYYPSGAIRGVFHFKAGLLHGFSAFYNEDGGILAKDFFFKGEQDGESLWYYSSGQLYSKQEFSKGLRHGPQLYYDIEGRLRTELHYQQGRMINSAKLYDAEGILERIVTFANPS